MEYDILPLDIGQGQNLFAVPVAYCKGGAGAVASKQPHKAVDILCEFFGESFELVLANYVRMEPEKIKQAGMPKNTENYTLNRHR